MKVLIVSHNVISLDGNMGKTLHAYFHDWAPEDLCQIYFHSEVPTTRLCEQYFRITDFDLVNAFRFRKPGTAFTRADIREERTTSRVDTGTAAQVYQAAQKRAPWMYFARNALWSLGAWKTKELDDWMERQRPDVIFFASGDYVFAYCVVRYLSEKYGIPVVTAVFDDYYVYRGESRSPLARWNTRVFRRTMEKMMKASKGTLYVHPAMCRAYDKAFQTHGRVLYASAACAEAPLEDGGPVRVSYLGGLGLKRYEALVQVGRLLRRLVPDGSVLLDVYSGERDPRILAQMTEENGIRFHGAVSAREVHRVEAESSILLLAESFAPELLERLRYSLSTKTAEYLASGRCMLAYGPREAGVIAYLLENGAGCVATSPEELKEKLREVLSSPEKRREYAARQLELARQNHAAPRNSAVLRETLENAVKEERA